MTDWKSRLYEGYISTKQSAASGRMTNKLVASDYPQHWHLIKKCLPSDKSIKIADLGCGYGSLLFCIKSMGYHNIEGVDVSSEQVLLAHQLGMNEIEQGDLFGFLKNKSRAYDVIFLMDVLEHLDKHEVINLLDLINDSLSDNGRVVIHVPNGEGLFGMRIRYGDFTHQVCFTPRSIGQVLRATGFDVIKVFEEKPLVRGVKGLVRRSLWALLTMRVRILLLAETGATGHILSQNMLVIAEK